MKILTTINGKPLIIQDELYSKLYNMEDKEARAFFIESIIPLNVILNKEENR